jgi:hypothetical protein
MDLSFPARFAAISGADVPISFEAALGWGLEWQRYSSSARTGILRVRRVAQRCICDFHCLLIHPYDFQISCILRANGVRGLLTIWTQNQQARAAPSRPAPYTGICALFSSFSWLLKFKTTCFVRLHQEAVGTSHPLSHVTLFTSPLPHASPQSNDGGCKLELSALARCTEAALLPQSRGRESLRAAAEEEEQIYCFQVKICFLPPAFLLSSTSHASPNRLTLTPVGSILLLLLLLLLLPPPLHWLDPF